MSGKRTLADLVPIDPQRLHLVTCAGVAHDLVLLGHFIEHYRALGVPTTNMHMILNAPSRDEPALGQAIDVLAAYAIEPAEIWIATYTSDSMWQRRRDVQRLHVPEHAWMLSADIDEFHEYPCELTQFLAVCEARQVNCVDGVLIDRLAPAGELIAPEHDRSPELTFPLQRVLQGSTFKFGQHHDPYGSVKAMAVAGSQLLGRGGHGVIDELERTKYVFGFPLGTFPKSGDPKFRAKIPLRVHHYKWTASLKRSLESRLGARGVSVAGQEYGQQVLDHLLQHDMRIDLSHAAHVPPVNRWPLSPVRSVERIRRSEKRRRKTKKKMRKLRRKMLRLLGVGNEV